MKDKMNNPKFPVWYRPYIILPVLLLIYIGIPSIWTFSPHFLTNSMPYFLVGASDYGISNIYAFTKIIFWLGLVLGAIANVKSKHPDEMNLLPSIGWRLRQNIWYLVAALLLTLGVGPNMESRNTSSWHEIWLLTGYLYSGVLIVLFIHSYAQIRTWPRQVRATFPVLIAMVWGFVRVSVENP